MDKLKKYYEKIMVLSENVVRLSSEKEIKVATAESCTGGMISGAITSVSGSSSVIEYGLCSYSNRIKHEVLGVSARTLEEFSEYSIPCAEEMAQGALRNSDADYAVSTTGVAGPTGGTEEHPVGEVFIGIAGKGGVFAKRFVFEGSREEVRAQACGEALELLLTEIRQQSDKK